MKRLVDCIEIVANNKECVVLEVLPDNELPLRCFGYFTGNETMFRITKGLPTTGTIFYKDDSCISWQWQCQNEEDKAQTSIITERALRMIYTCIENDLDIVLHGLPETMQESLKIQSKKDLAGITHNIEVMRRKEQHIIKNGNAMRVQTKDKPPAELPDIIRYFENLGFQINDEIETKRRTKL